MTYLVAVSDTWIGITKNQPGITTFGTGADEITNAEKYLVYEDGTSYKDIGGIKYAVNQNSECFRFPANHNQGTEWSDGKCTAQSVQYNVLCEYNCDNINNS